MICKEYKNDLEKIRRATAEELSAIAGIGGVIGTSVEEYFKDEEHNRWLNDLMKELELEQNQEPEGEQTLDGKIFVITGSLEQEALPPRPVISSTMICCLVHQKIKKQKIWEWRSSLSRIF